MTVHQSPQRIPDAAWQEIAAASAQLAGTIGGPEAVIETLRKLAEVFPVIEPETGYEAHVLGDLFETLIRALSK
jgi:hypothetical protein